MVGGEPMRDLEEAGERQGCMRCGEGGIEFYRLSEVGLRRDEIRAVASEQVPHAALMMLPRAEVLGRFASRSFPLGRADLRLHRRRNRVGNLVLNRENVLNWSIVSLGPKMAAGFGVDQLCRDTDALPGTGDAPLQYISNAKLACHLPYFYSLVLVSECRTPRDDKKRAKAG